MRKKQAQNRPFRPSDYNDPTEPLEAVELPLYLGPQNAVDGAYPVATTVPAPQPNVVLPPTDALPAYPYYQPPQGAYPVLPPPPLKKYRGSPPGGSPWSYDYDRVPRRRRRRSALPGLVRFVLVLVQLVLLTRALCMLFGVQSTATWLTLLFSAGDLFVQPARWLAANINLSVLAGTQLLVYLEFLAAILAYGLLSRILTLLLRALLD